MLTGVPPFSGSSTYEVLDEVCSAQPVPISDIRSDIPNRIESLVQQLLQKDRNRRCPTTGHVQGLLAAADLDLRRPAPAPVKRRRALAVIASVALLACMIWACSMLFGKKGDFSLHGHGDFASLVEAINAAGHNDVIEIHGNGPYVLDPIEIGSRSITIQAGPKHSPVLRMSNPSAPLFVTSSVLKLAGLEIENLVPSGEFDGEWTDSQESLVVVNSSGRFHAAYCCFRLGENRPCAYHTGKLVSFRQLRDWRPGFSLGFMGFPTGGIGDDGQQSRACKDWRGSSKPHRLRRPHRVAFRADWLCPTMQYTPQYGFLWITGKTASRVHSLDVTLENNVFRADAFVTLRPTFCARTACPWHSYKHGKRCKMVRSNYDLARLEQLVRRCWLFCHTSSACRSCCVV